MDRSIPLYVPEGAIEAYRNADTWQEFDIQAAEQIQTAIETTVTNGLSEKAVKVLREGTLYIIRGGKAYTVQGLQLQ